MPDSKSDNLKAEVPRISYSQLGVWNRCEHSWKWSYLEGWKPQEKKEYFERGTLIHELLQEHYNNWIPGEDTDTTLERLLGFLEARVLSLSNFQEVERYQRAGWLLRRWIESRTNIEWDHDAEILASEQELVIPLTTPGGLKYELIIVLDLLLKRNGKIILRDFKSSEGRFLNQIQLMMDSQIPVYCAVLRSVGYSVWGAEFGQFNTYDYKDKSKATADRLFKLDKTYRTPAELDSIFHQFGIAMEDILIKKDSPDYEYRKSLSKDCNLCRFQEPCLQEIKGYDPQPILRSNFFKVEK